jgi:hypothetical protein
MTFAGFADPSGVAGSLVWLAACLLLVSLVASLVALTTAVLGNERSDFTGVCAALIGLVFVGLAVLQISGFIGAWS